MKDLTYVYDNIHDFYTDALNPTEDGNINDCRYHLKEDDERFRGLGLEEILKSKYNYQKGLDNLKEIEIDISLGGSSRKYVYDEFDGDDLNYDRLLEGFPAMRKRVKTYGIGSGRLVNVYVVISENCCVGASAMINKAYTAIQIVDMLEAMGYRVAVWACDSTDDPGGKFQEENGVHYRMYEPECMGKRPLVLFLHGGGECGEDNELQLTGTLGALRLAERWSDMYIMAPQAPSGNLGMQEMFEVMKKRGNPFSADMGITPFSLKGERGWNRDYVAKVTDIIRKMISDGKVDENRVYLIGMSMGGGGVLQTISVAPDLFAAAGWWRI